LALTSCFARGPETLPALDFRRQTGAAAGLTLFRGAGLFTKCHGASGLVRVGDLSHKDSTPIVIIAPWRPEAGIKRNGTGGKWRAATSPPFAPKAHGAGQLATSGGSKPAGESDGGHADGFSSGIYWAGLPDRKSKRTISASSPSPD